MAMSSNGNRGFDREGHSVCYNAYGVFRDTEMYERIFGDEEKLEKGINLLHFKPGGVNSLIQVTNLKDMPKRELRIFVNVPWYFSMLYSMFYFFEFSIQISTFISAFAFFFLDNSKFIRPEDIPVQYGRLSRPSDLQNGPPKPTSKFTVKGGEKVNIQLPSSLAIHNSQLTTVAAGVSLFEIFLTVSKKGEDKQQISK
ncbi:hypothetical protein UlMin_034765 [Ulmus minor]